MYKIYNLDYKTFSYGQEISFLTHRVRQTLRLWKDSMNLPEPPLLGR